MKKILTSVCSLTLNLTNLASITRRPALEKSQLSLSSITLKNKQFRRFLAFFLIFAVCIFTLAASPAAVNFDNLSKDKKFETLLLDFGNAYYSIRYSDISNKNAKTKEIKAAKKLYSYLNFRKNLNYDERILKLLAARCLYNYDEVKFNKIQADFSEINAAFPEKAEHHWVYGNLLISMGRSTEGKNELEQYMKMKNYMLNGFFIEDYAYAQLMCMMPFNALYSITNGGTISEAEVKNQNLLKMIKGNIKESSSDEKYDSNHVWRVSQTDGEYNYIYSTMLGISFPCKGEWDLSMSPFTAESPAICLLKPDGFSIEGNNVSISILLMAYPESIYTESAKNKLIKNVSAVKADNEEISHKLFEKYTYEDPSKYNDIRKGAKGYLYFATITPEKWIAAKCEHETDFSTMYDSEGKKEKKSASYFAISPSMDRLKEPVNVMILVDSCNALAEDTEKLLNELFSRSVF